MIIYLIILFVITVAFGSFPLWYKDWSENKLNALLAFSASFLMGLSFLHLMPETYEHLGLNGGIFILIGFIGQSFFQKYTHGLEHGHVHSSHALGKASIWTIISGMSIHAIFEGIPLGISGDQYTSFYLAILFHKIPEAMVVVAFLSIHDQQQKNKRAWLFLMLFALLTPLSAGISNLFVQKGVHTNFSFIIFALISGMFLQIASTIYFEISNNQHVIKKYKWPFILLGFLLSLASINIH